MMKVLALALACAVCVCGAPVSAAVSYTTEVAAVRASTAPPLDASLSAPIWQTAVRATGFWNYTERQPARLPTTAMLLYDEKNLYVGFVAVQKGVPITATQAVNDVGYGVDDSVTVAIDTSNDNSRTYTFSVTPDGVRYETSSESSRYQPPWRAVAKRTSDGYNVMMEIPLSDMRTQGGAAQNWRIDFNRHIAATGDLYSWAYVPGSDAYCSNNSVSQLVYCISTRWPEITGIHAPMTAAVRPKPYADMYALSSSGSDRNVFYTTPSTAQTVNPRTLGVDFTYPFTLTMSLVGTLNPDFSNVEEDQTTIAPQEFTRHYTEYRPFFAQGFSFIDTLPHINVNGTGSTIFYTPSIGVVNSGFKVEGTAGLNSIGALTATGPGYDDQAFGFQNSRPDGSFNVSLEGVMAHHPGIVDDTFGLGLGFVNPHSGLSPLISFEQERGTLVGTPSQANNLDVGGVLQHGPLQIGLLFKDVGAEFAPVDGYTPVNDLIGPVGFFQYNGTGTKNGSIKSYQFSYVGDRFVDRSGAAHQADSGGGAGVTFKNLLSLNVGGGTSNLRSYLDAYPYYVGGQTFPFNQTQLSVGYKDGTPNPTDFNYSFGPFAMFCPGSQPQPLVCTGAPLNFASAYTHQLDVSTTRALGRYYGLTLEYGGTVAHGMPGPLDSQWLRRIALTRSFGSNGEFAIALRSINGTGGFAAPGVNLAFSYHQRFRDQDNLYVEYGTPAAPYTLHRFIVKYVFHTGGAGT
ncbi:MAG TPA: carbohydrate binding family 9 domain-containing protein [Candidatus Baltobacteraceae bacterium]|nr:carbohydrate binding family 9 domain-containing protein [Candidatus Baltobacteraceae bacterium]